MKRIFKTVIIDDEPPAWNIIKKYLEKVPDVKIVAECSNGFEGIKAVQELQPDLIFLDIQMPKISGFEMLELLEDEPVIIFTTAFDEYAVKAFEVNAADYLLKPFSQQRLIESVEKARKLFVDKSKQKNIVSKLIKHHDSNIEYLERIVVRTSTKIEILPVSAIFWFEAQDDYVKVHSQEGNYLKQKTMKFFEKHLNPNDFIRIHRPHIVRISDIKQIEPFTKTAYQVILANGVSLPLSKTGYQKIKVII